MKNFRTYTEEAYGVMSVVIGTILISSAIMFSIDVIFGAIWPYQQDNIALSFDWTWVLSYWKEFGVMLAIFGITAIALLYDKRRQTTKRS